ncbi:MAG TPA: semialdehyde dehydrogenase, partial [Chitinophagaceae bacterium]
SDVLFCAIGSTMKKVKGDKEAYRKIDFEIPVKLARFCKMTGCEKFILVSSAGANSQSRNFYQRLKGETDEAVKGSGLKTIHIMRPSLLLGERKEFRLGENIGKAIMTSLSFLIPEKYKAIQGRDVAKVMLALAKKNDEGILVHENTEIRNLSK